MGGEVGRRETFAGVVPMFGESIVIRDEFEPQRGVAGGNHVVIHVVRRGADVAIRAHLAVRRQVFGADHAERREVAGRDVPFEMFGEPFFGRPVARFAADAARVDFAEGTVCGRHKRFVLRIVATRACLGGNASASPLRREPKPKPDGSDGTLR